MRLVTLALLGIGFFLVSCSIGTPAALRQRTDDFEVVYEWNEGSLPPPYHYEVVIRVAPTGAGEITMLPDYEYSDPPRWVETFTLSVDQLDALYALMLEKGVFSRTWADADDLAAGGESEWMVVTAGGNAYKTPVSLSPRQRDIIAPLYDEINALVPPEIWEKLNARREAYMSAFEE